MEWSVSRLGFIFHVVDEHLGGTSCLHLQGDSLDCVDAEVVGKKGVRWLYGKFFHITKTLHSFLYNPISTHTIRIVTMKMEAVHFSDTSVCHIACKPKRRTPTDQQPWRKHENLRWNGFVTFGNFWGEDGSISLCCL